MKRLQLLILLLVFMPQIRAQDDNTPLIKKIAELEAENDRLRKQIERLEQDLAIKTKELVKIRQILKTLEAERDELKKLLEGNKNDSNPLEQVQNPVGPEVPVKGKVLVINKELRFIVIDIGEKEGLKKGYRFDIVRDNKLIATAELEAFLGEGKRSKLKIIEGDASDIKYNDDVIARRKLDLKSFNQSAKGKPTKKFRITGAISADAFVINVGSADGLKFGDRVYVVHDNKQIAILRLTYVDKEFSVGKIMEGTKEADVKKDDDISIEEIKIKEIVGRIIHIDKDGIYVDVGTAHGARPGQKYEVRRAGIKIAEIVLREVSDKSAIANLAEGFAQDSIKFDDFIELIQD